MAQEIRIGGGNLDAGTRFADARARARQLALQEQALRFQQEMESAKFNASIEERNYQRANQGQAAGANLAKERVNGGLRLDALRQTAQAADQANQFKQEQAGMDREQQRSMQEQQLGVQQEGQQMVSNDRALALQQQMEIEEARGKREQDRQGFLDAESMRRENKQDDRFDLGQEQKLATVAAAEESKQKEILLRGLYAEEARLRPLAQLSVESAAQHDAVTQQIREITMPEPGSRAEALQMGPPTEEQPLGQPVHTVPQEKDDTPADPSMDPRFAELSPGAQDSLMRRHEKDLEKVEEKKVQAEILAFNREQMEEKKTERKEIRRAKEIRDNVKRDLKSFNDMSAADAEALIDKYEKDERYGDRTPEAIAQLRDNVPAIKQLRLFIGNNKLTAEETAAALTELGTTGSDMWSDNTRYVNNLLKETKAKTLDVKAALKGMAKKQDDRLAPLREAAVSPVGSPLDATSDEWSRPAKKKARKIAAATLAQSEAGEELTDFEDLVGKRGISSGFRDLLREEENRHMGADKISYGSHSLTNPTTNKILRSVGGLGKSAGMSVPEYRQMLRHLIGVIDREGSAPASSVRDYIEKWQASRAG